MDRIMEHTQQTLTIDAYSSEGDGVARLDGAAVFSGGLVETSGSMSTRWDLRRLGTCGGGPLPLSRPDQPGLSLFSRCGGCRFRHMTYEEELSAKRRGEDALRRIGGLSLPVSEMLGAAHPERYRNKAQFPVAPAPGSSCYQAAPTPSPTWRTACSRAKRPPPTDRHQAWIRVPSPAYPERAGKGLVRHVYVRTNRRGESLFCLLVNGPSVPREDELVQTPPGGRARPCRHRTGCECEAP